MPVRSARVAVDATRDAVASARDADSFVIKNGGASPVYLGDATVTDTTGFALAVDDSVVLDLRAEDVLYGVCAAGQSTTLHILKD